MFKRNSGVKSFARLNMKTQQALHLQRKRVSFAVEDEDEEADKDDKSQKLRGPEAPLYNAICPVVYALKVFGFAPYVFDKDDLVPSHLFMMFTFINFIFYTFIFVSFFRKFTFSGVNSHEAAILVTTEKGKVILNYLVLSIHLLETILNRKKFVDTWNSIANFDECMKKKGYVRSEFSTKIRMWMLVVCNLVIWFSVNQAGMSAFFEPWYKNVSYLLLYVTTAASLYKYIGIVFILGQRFKFLNKIAGMNEMAIQNDVLKFENDTKWIEVMFSDLMTTSEKFVAYHTWSLFLWIFNLGIHTVSNMYYLLEWCSSGNVDVPYYFIWCLISWMFAYVFQVVLLHVCCHFTSSQANYMGYVLLDHRKALMSSGNCDYDNLQSTLHLLNRKLKFLAAGCFDVNLPLLRSMIGVTTTYLIILMQLPDDDGINDSKFIYDELLRQ